MFDDANLHRKARSILGSTVLMRVNALYEVQRGPQRNAEEELQSRQRRIERDRRRALVDQMQLETPKVLGRGSVRQTFEVSKLAYGKHVAGLRLGLELTRVHVLEHALTQRRDAR